MPRRRRAARGARRPDQPKFTCEELFFIPKPLTGDLSKPSCLPPNASDATLSIICAGIPGD